jgi:hypothetical protein
VRLRLTLESLERTALDNEGPMSFHQLQKIFRPLRETLVFLGSKLLGDGETMGVPGQNSLEVTWDMYDSEAEAIGLPMTRTEAEDVFNKLQIQVGQLRAV